jgi:hypothetical protein
MVIRGSPAIKDSNKNRTQYTCAVSISSRDVIPDTFLLPLRMGSGTIFGIPRLHILYLHQNHHNDNISTNKTKDDIKNLIFYRYCNMYLLTELEGQTGTYFAQGYGRDQGQQCPYRMNERQIFSLPAQPNSVNKHFIIYMTRQTQI